MEISWHYVIVKMKINKTNKKTFEEEEEKITKKFEQTLFELKRDFLK